MAEVTKEIFIEEYQKFNGSDSEFAEFLNEKYNPDTPLNAKSVETRRRRANIKTKNPKKIGDTAGFKKFIQGFKGKEIYKGFVTDNAKKFGIDRGTASDIIDDIRPDIKDLPYKPSKETLRKEAVKKKNINFLNDKEFKKELKKFKPVVTGSDAEFAEYLNKQGFRAFGNIPFTTDAVSSRRLRLDLEGKNITTRGKVFSDEDILKQAKEMKLDIRGKKADEIRKAVLSSRNLEIGRSPEDVKKLRDFRERKVLMAGKERIFPVTIGKDATPKDLFWKDLVDNAQRHQSYLKNRPGPILAESHIKFLNPNEGRPTDTKGFKKIKLVDTNVIGKQNKPTTLTYDNFLNHLDKNSKTYGIESKTAMEEYKKKRFIQKNPELRNEFNLKLNSRYDPTSATKRAVFSPFHIHHTAGRGANAFNVQFAVGTENMAENAFRRTFDKEFKAANTLTDKKAAVKKYLDAVPENLEVRLKKTPYGTRETLTEVTTRIAPELSEAVSNAIKLYEDAGPDLKVQLEDRIGCKRGCFIQTVTQEPQKVMDLVKPVSATTTNSFRETGLKWNNDVGAFETTNGDIASQSDLKKYAADNPMEVKVGEEPVKAATNKSVLANVGKAMARIGAPLPTAVLDSYFIGQQVKEGKGTAEIASNPLNWLGLATMEPLTKISGVAEGSGTLNKALRLGLNPATIRGISRFAGLPGLAVSTAMTAYDQYQKYKDGEGFIFNLLNQKGTE